jgi:septal ring-binding cell division protein DamX
MYKDLVLQEAEAFKKYLLRGTPAVPAPEEAASAAASAAAASADALAAAELAASVANEAARVASQAEQVASAASAAASAAVAPVAVVASTPASGASADAVEKPKADKERKAEKADAKADVKADAKTDAKANAKVEAKAEANSDEAWVDQLPANAYVVQLAAMDTQEEMRSFQRSNAAYSKARIMRARHKDNGKRYFILVAGPFETKAQADAFMQSSPLLAKGWLRTSKSMKTQFTKS